MYSTFAYKKIDICEGNLRCDNSRISDETLNSLHRIYGGLRIIQVCRHWPRWLNEYFGGLTMDHVMCYRMRCGINLNTRHNRSDFHMIDEIWAYRKDAPPKASELILRRFSAASKGPQLISREHAL